MSGESLRVVAHLVAKPDKVAELRDMLAGLITPTRAEPGCIAYELLQSQDNPTELTFVEEWTSESALDGHVATKHIKDALSKAPDLLAAELGLRRYDLIG